MYFDNDDDRETVRRILEEHPDAISQALASAVAMFSLRMATTKVTVDELTSQLVPQLEQAIIEFVQHHQNRSGKN